MTDDELLREANFRGSHSSVIAAILTRFEAMIDDKELVDVLEELDFDLESPAKLRDALDRFAADTRRQALHDAADDFEAGASPDDIRSNAERT
jgi:hypothetical protein